MRTNMIPVDLLNCDTIRDESSSVKDQRRCAKMNLVRTEISGNIKVHLIYNCQYVSYARSYAPEGTDATGWGKLFMFFFPPSK